MLTYVIMKWVNHQYVITDKAYTSQILAARYCGDQKTKHIYIPVTLIEYEN
jgi:hypothetical protein